MYSNILIVDDNPEICEIVTILLENEHYNVVFALTGDAGLNLVNNTIDLIILDVSLPDISGFKLCEKIRELTMVPILFLTAKTRDIDKETGFNVGGDDYLSKPFSSIELIARVKALLRRYHYYKDSSSIKFDHLITLGDLCINKTSKEVSRNGLSIKLTGIEFEILLCLLANKSTPLSAKKIYEVVWKEPFLHISNNTVMVHVKNLRQKIEQDYKQPKYIKTVWGKGYVIN